jgi:hypothetical protein
MLAANSVKRIHVNRNRLAFIYISLWILATISCEQASIPITYEVTGTASTVDIDYIYNSAIGVAHASGVSLPWRFAFTVLDGNWFGLTVKKDGGNGDVTATIYKNGRYYVSVTGNGPNAEVAARDR